ncbi:hypothetical protein C0993_009775 [Termitomyces sp. T159_Od127]|nr:hypothetical protein C0993_009775 [Termitomyces sp. T159_Od127]
MQFKSLFVFASLPVLLFAQTTPAEIESAITNDFVPALAADLAAVDAFPVDGGTLDEAMGPIIQQALMDVATREPGIEAVGAATTIQQDLAIVQASSDAMGETLLSCVSVCPSVNLFAQTINVNQSNVAPDVQAFQSAVDAAFAPAVSAFN